MIKTYRKKPVEIQAIQLTEESASECLRFINGTKKHRKGVYHFIDMRSVIDIETLEGTMRADIGDFIIKGVNGEFYPCKPDIFEKTYEEVDNGHL